MFQSLIQFSISIGTWIDCIRSRENNRSFDQGKLSKVTTTPPDQTAKITQQLNVRVPNQLTNEFL
jgi:hypothetical protein